MFHFRGPAPSMDPISPSTSTPSRRASSVAALVNPTFRLERTPGPADHHRAEPRLTGGLDHLVVVRLVQVQPQPGPDDGVEPVHVLPQSPEHRTDGAPALGPHCPR
ncbi:hypothetical protein C0Q58_11405 [Streptomyces albidoflavus]|nr:hypothetical protein C0Q58_11405 [Streptomyces albidoflavus]